MARKSDKTSAFNSIDNSKVYAAVSRAQNTKGKHIEASQAEQEQRKAELRTQGKKGCKAVRINMAFTPDNHEFIKVLARISGKSMTEFTNYVIEQYRTEHPELYAEAKSIIDRM